MKLVIDIPDDEYKFIKDLQSLVISGRGNCKTIQYNVINAIKNGMPFVDNDIFTRAELESWLYQIAFNNCGNPLGDACEEIISRLDGFERFVVDEIKED